MSERVLIAAGGTGGHIYPALAIADQLKRLEPNLIIEFVGTPAGIENKIIPNAGYSLKQIPIGRLNNVSIVEKIITLITLPWAMFKALSFILKTKPRLVLGVGGYVSGALLLVASWLKRRTFIWEPNAYPGLTNRLLASHVDECLVVFDQARSLLKSKSCKRVGMPVRREIENLQAVRVEDGQFHVLIFGGSQGARAINDVVCDMLIDDAAWTEGIKFVHQTGPSDFIRIRERYATAGCRVEVREYLHDMDLQYAWADLVISRAGSGTLSELAATGKAAILIPLPTAADNHQQKNSDALVQAGAAELILQKDLTPQSLKNMIVELKNNPTRRAMMVRKIQKFHEPQAARAIAYHLLESSRQK